MGREHQDHLNDLNRRIARVLRDLTLVQPESFIVHDGNSVDCWRYHRTCLAQRIRHTLTQETNGG